MHQLAARALFERLLSVPDDELHLVRVALAIAAEEYPALDPEKPLRELDAAADRVLRTVPVETDPFARIRRLDALAFKELALDGRGTDFDDPESSFLHAVLERGRGLPIALSVLYVHLGRRFGLDLAGVGYPGHFLVLLRAPDGDVFVDPFNRGARSTEAELAARFTQASGGRALEPGMLDPAPPRQIVARMLRNLKALYMRRRDLPRAFSAVDRLLVATPDVADDVRDRGLLCEQLGGVAAARSDLERYLELAPDASDGAAIRARLRTLRPSVGVLN